MKEVFLKLNKDVILIDNYIYPRIIVANESNARVYPVNSTGILMLSLCDGIHTEKDIITIISNKYNVKKSIVQNDTRAFFKKKLDEKIVYSSDKKEKINVCIRGKDNIILPYQLSVETTNQCQLKCKHCYNKSGLKRAEELTVDELIIILEQYKDLGGTSIMLTGGEIFLKNDVIKLIDYVANNFIRVVVLTNGYTLTNNILNKLIEYRNKIGIQISLDGMEENHDYIRGVDGAFKSSINNIKKLVSSGISVSVACTLNERNVIDLPKLVKIVKDVGCSSINIGAVSSIGRAEENGLSSVQLIKNLKEIISDMRNKYEDVNFKVGESIDEYKDEVIDINGVKYDNKCGAGYKILHIFSDGRVGLCPSHGSIIDKFNLGNLKCNTLAEILNYENLKYVMDIPNPTRDLCGCCAYYEECAQCIVSMLNRTKEECKIVRRLYEKKIID